jgi:hypothetical protein
MPEPFFSLDPYNVRARLAPVLLVTIPFGLSCTAWFGAEKQLAGVLTGATITLVLTILGAQLGRDAGKRKQQ